MTFSGVPNWRFSDGSLDASQVIIRNDSSIPLRPCLSLNRAKEPSSTNPGERDCNTGGSIGLEPQSPYHLVVQVYSGVQVYTECIPEPGPGPGTIYIDTGYVKYTLEKVRLRSTTDLTNMFPQFGDGIRPVFSVDENGRILTVSLI